MGSPFPGMDPWLEHPALWPDVHNSLIAALRDWLAPLVRPRYVVRIEERTYLADIDDGLFLVGVPYVTIGARREEPRRDVAATTAEPVKSATGVAVEVPLPSVVRETWLEVRLPAGGQVVTTIELLSPTNKLPGEGRRLYETKRSLVLGSPTNLVEVDLARAGEPMPLRGVVRRGGYSILVSRGDRRPHATLFPFGLRDPIPSFPVPLRPGDPEPEVDLSRLLDDLYERAAYDLTIDYVGDPVPPLEEPDRAWAERLLVAAGRRAG